MAGLLYRLGRFSARRHWLVIGTWLVLIALAAVAFSLFKGPISSSISIPGTPTAKVTDELATSFPKASGGSGSLVFETTDGGRFTAAQKSDIAALLSDIGDEKGVRSTVDPFVTQQKLDDQRAKLADGRTKLDAAEQQAKDGQAQLDAQKAQLAAAPAAVAQAAQPQLDAAQQQLDDGAAQLATQKQKLDDGAKLLDLSSKLRFVSSDGSAAVGSVQFTTSTIQVPAELKKKVVDTAEDAGIRGVHVYVSNDIAQSVPNVVGPGEVVGLVIAAIVLIVMLGTALGAGLPLLSALVGLGGSLLTAMSFSGLVEFNSVTTVLGIMLGLAVGIDYSLFILNRHRTQLRRGVDLHESIGLANGTSGNAVVFAGATVIVALLALNITGVPFLGLMGTVGGAAVAVAILVAVTFTPAVLSLVGMRILRKKERAAIGAATHHASRLPARPMRTWRAIVTLIAGVAVLGVVALPALEMRFGLPVGSSEAVDSSQYKAYKTVDDSFGAGRNGPLLVVADLPSKVTDDTLTSAEAAIGERIAATDSVVAVAPIGASTNGRVLAFQVIPKDGPDAVSTETLVHDLRDLSPLRVDTGTLKGDTVQLGVAGNASAQIDVAEKLADALPLYLVVVVGLSLLILIVVFRSILVPITATAGFVLSLLATFGGLTAIYQFGWLAPVFGVHDPAPILAFLPIIEVGVLFGLAMDYQLFLVSGMRESYAHGAPARLAVQRGLHAGRAVVTAAAIIMISVFSGFIFSESATIRPIGFGLAFGVLVDAFVVRMLLIPAAMHLLGRAAWWIPRWLDRILPDVDVEGAKLERSHPHEGTDDEPDTDAPEHGRHAVGVPV